VSLIFSVSQKSKKYKKMGGQYSMPVILATQEVRKISFQSQPEQIVLKTLP
jgi:hypothetical protein